MQEELRKILEIIRRSGEIILERQASKLSKDLVITVGAENIIGLTEEGIKELSQQREGPHVGCQRTS